MESTTSPQVPGCSPGLGRTVATSGNVAWSVVARAREAPKHPRLGLDLEALDREMAPTKFHMAWPAGTQGKVGSPPGVLSPIMSWHTCFKLNFKQLTMKLTAATKSRLGVEGGTPCVPGGAKSLVRPQIKI